MNEPLKNCPFCGSKDVTKSLGVGMKWTVGCNNCGCRTRECTHSIDAEDSWNRRVNDDCETQRISNIVADMMSRGYPDDDCDENHMSMPLPISETPF